MIFSIKMRINVFDKILFILFFQTNCKVIQKYISRCIFFFFLRLSAAGPDILSDVDLVINLETTKKTAAEIEIKVAEAKITSIKIDEAREIYRVVAARASLLYFVLNDLYKINMLYQFSLKAFSVVFLNAIKFAEASDEISKRVDFLIDSITFLVFTYTSRGLFEADKLTFLTQMTIQVHLFNNRFHFYKNLVKRCKINFFRMIIIIKCNFVTIILFIDFYGSKRNNTIGT